MSHIGNGENDFEGLDQMTPEMADWVKEIRILARSIVDNLEPCHISTYQELIDRLQAGIQRVAIKREANRIRNTPPSQETVMAFTRSPISPR
ncbi:MAG TPA: hypothetical protein VJJ72_00870 [Candidatus Paceibacterota bacterium]